MPINYTQIRGQINQFGKQAAEHDSFVGEAVINTLKELHSYSNQLTRVAERIVQAEAKDHSLRCACPLGEALDQVCPLPEDRSKATLIAADGSQIIPSRHRQVPFGLINIASIKLVTESGDPPVIKTDSKLLSWNDFQSGSGAALQEFISQERDIQERHVLAIEASSYPLPVITLMDGPLELFREPGDQKAYALALEKYRVILEDMHQHGTLTAGYVDKPQSDLVNRLLRLLSGQKTQTGMPATASAGGHWFPDIDLFKELLTNPGDRSAVYGIQSPWNNLFAEPFRSCFFYMNVSRTNKPYLVRIELPFWCTQEPSDVAAIQAHIYQQCQIMGARPYPYLLHRAHELALVTRDETDQLEMMLAFELHSHGLDPNRSSHKQAAKDLPGRRRFS